MNDSEFSQQVQRLVDQQLAAEERAELLRVAENDPLRYRQIALAFVETQVLDEQLACLTPWLKDKRKRGTPIDELESKEEAHLLKPASSNGRLNAGPISLRADEGDDKATKHGPQPINGVKHASLRGHREKLGASRSTGHGGGKTFWIAIAASLALAIPASLTGYWLGDAHRSDLNRARMAGADDLAPSTQQGRRPAGDFNSSDPVTVDGSAENAVVTDVSSGAEHLPFGAGPTISPAIPEHVRMQLLRSGFVLGEETQVVQVETDEGQIVDVPVTQLKVNYLGNRIYQ